MLKSVKEPQLLKGSILFCSPSSDGKPFIDSVQTAAAPNPLIYHKAPTLQLNLNTGFGLEKNSSTLTSLPSKKNNTYVIGLPLLL